MTRRRAYTEQAEARMEALDDACTVAYEAGYAAGANGVAYEENPYFYDGIELRNAWETGWIWGKERS